MDYSVGNVYICPIINAMGPVIDPRHNDLLNSWSEIEILLNKLFAKNYRSAFPDSGGNNVIFSWFFISWSGFRSNPVNRDFGYFNIYDYYKKWLAERDQYGDGLYWMYNHPAASGVGNEWGLDWFDNSQYLEVLMRFIAERSYFPSVVEVVTEKNDTSLFLENFFPFDLGNRNCLDLNWQALNADGKAMFEVIDWRRAKHSWEIYSPHENDYQIAGNMKRKIGRLLDIKTIVYELKESEIEKGFQMALEGKDVMISAYEHDFRDRADVIQERLLLPVTRIAEKYPEVKWFYKNSLDAFNLVAKNPDTETPNFTLSRDRNNNLLIHSDQILFGNIPFTFFKRENRYSYISPLRIGEKTWLIYQDSLIDNADFFIAANNISGKSKIQRFSL